MGVPVKATVADEPLVVNWETELLAKTECVEPLVLPFEERRVLEPEEP